MGGLSPNGVRLEEIPFHLTFLNFHQKNETAFIFTKEIPLKMNRTKKLKSPSII